ncbi:hypothetical protein KCU78_g14025, partial [Aureobasidium melanogenum]
MAAAAVSPKPQQEQHQTPKKSPTEPNVLNVVLGNIQIKPWYPSFYPEDLVGRKAERLYVCECCFRYSKELMPYLAHRRVCPLRDSPPPGTLIYQTADQSIYEIDGEEHKLYSQNLSLFAKLFLDTKSVFYDVTTFRYYLLVLTDPQTAENQVVGFFSKEKMSWDNNNVACILVFPPWQKRGLGQLLMGVSYELSRREGRLGGPEKPLSSLGRKAYLAYWSASICRTILLNPSNRSWTVDQIVQQTWIAPEDVVMALSEAAMIEPNKLPDGSVILVRGKIELWVRAHETAAATPAIDRSAFTQTFRDQKHEHEARR